MSAYNLYKICVNNIKRFVTRLFESSHENIPLMSQQPSQKLVDALTQLEVNEKLILDQAHRMLKAYNRALYGFDLLAVAAAKRSLALSVGFRTMVRDQNLICAGAILRLQLDTALRIFAGFIVDNPHDFAIEVIEGKRINKIKDQNGRPMTDHYLVTQLARKYPEYQWIKSTYKETSNYIHFSDTHFFSALDRGSHEGQPGFRIAIGARDNDIPDNVYLNAIKTFHNSTGILVRFIEGWIITKDNPEKIVAMKSQRNDT